MSVRPKSWFFSRGKVKCFPKFFIKQEEIEVVEDYVYLGVTFMFNGGFKKVIDEQIYHGRNGLKFGVHMYPFRTD